MTIIAPTHSITKASPHGSFIVWELNPRLAICESKADQHNWGNSTPDRPAFLAYIGCSDNDDVQYWLAKLGEWYGIKTPIEVRKSKYLRNYPVELKVRGLSRYTTSEQSMGLEWPEDYDREYTCLKCQTFWAWYCDLPLKEASKIDSSNYF